MTQIITAPDGTRYRTTGDHVTEDRIREKGLTFLTPTGFVHDASNYRMLPIPGGERLEPLPHIPDWPLPGPAPQHLGAGDNLKLEDGDWICAVGKNHAVFFFLNQESGRRHRAIAQQLRDIDPTQRGYLIARLNPAEDIDPEQREVVAV